MMGRQQKPVRWKVCVPAAVGWMEMAAGALYVRAYFDEADKREAMAMIDDLQKAFKTIVTKLDWMDDETKHFSIEKVCAIAFKKKNAVEWLVLGPCRLMPCCLILDILILY